MTQSGTLCADWKTVKFGEVVRNVRETEHDPLAAGLRTCTSKNVDCSPREHPSRAGSGRGKCSSASEGLPAEGRRGRV
jgi:hypothetical protein